GQLGQPARDLGLAHARRPDHQDVLGRDLGAQLVLDLLAPPAVAQRNGHGTLGFLLADDVPIQLVNNLLRRHAHINSSMPQAATQLTSATTFTWRRSSSIPGSGSAGPADAPP